MNWWNSLQRMERFFLFFQINQLEVDTEFCSNNRNQMKNKYTQLKKLHLNIAHDWNNVTIQTMMIQKKKSDDKFFYWFNWCILYRSVRWEWLKTGKHYIILKKKHQNRISLFFHNWNKLKIIKLYHSLFHYIW